MIEENDQAPASDETEQLPRPDNNGQTHYEGCWQERGHHNCAVMMIRELAQDPSVMREETLRRKCEALQAENERLREENAALNKWKYGRAKPSDYVEKLVSLESERDNYKAEAADAEMLLDDECSWRDTRIEKLEEALKDIYANRGEDEFIAAKCGEVI